MRCFYFAFNIYVRVLFYSWSISFDDSDNYLMVDEKSAGGYEVSPEVWPGYSNLYTVISSVVLFLDETIMIPQIGF